MSAHFFDKQPGEKFAITSNFADVLDTGETISTKSVAAAITTTGVDATTTVIDSSSIAGQTILITVKAGTSGVSYKITVVITTSSGQIFEDEIVMHVVEQ